MTFGNPVELMAAQPGTRALVRYRYPSPGGADHGYVPVLGWALVEEVTLEDRPLEMVDEIAGPEPEWRVRRIVPMLASFEMGATICDSDLETVVGVLQPDDPDLSTEEIDSLLSYWRSKRST